MKICAIICEFNPFHNGHKHLIDEVRRTGRFDGILCIMSGHFTQRGDRAIADKFTRAAHAVKGGADCVIELPAPFAVAPADVFACGAVKIASSIPEVCALAFGCETPKDFFALAERTAEDGEFRELMGSGLKKGESYAKSYADALEKTAGTAADKPNDILALEYAKAIKKYRPDIEAIAIERVGGGYNDVTLGGGYASASAIRAHLCEDGVRQYMPGYAYDDLRAQACPEHGWEAIVKYALSAADADGLGGVFGGSEGLGNRLKKLRRLSCGEMTARATCRRYPSSRIRRLLTANALQLNAAKTLELLESAGYIKPLAVRADRADDMLRALASSPFATVITGNDAQKLCGADRELYEATAFADDVWCAAAGRDVYDCTIVKLPADIDKSDGIC